MEKTESELQHFLKRQIKQLGREIEDKEYELMRLEDEIKCVENTIGYNRKLKMDLENLL